MNKQAKIKLGIITLSILVGLFSLYFVLAGYVGDDVNKVNPKQSFYFENYNLDILSGNTISYKRNGEMQNRISIVINNSELNKKVTIIIAYPNYREFRGIEGGFDIKEINVANKYGLVASKLAQHDTGDLINIAQSKIKNFEFKVFDLILESESEGLGVNYSINDIRAYTTTELGENDLLYIWILGSFAGGSGTAEDPYQISTCLQLNETRDDLDASYILINDINCSDTINWNSGAGWKPIGTVINGFVFDGDGYTISDLYINRDIVQVGLFSQVDGVGGTVLLKNIKLENVNITGGGASETGALSGFSRYADISEISVSGIVSGSNEVGGLIGHSFYNSIVTNSYSSANVTGIDKVGGLIGYSRGLLTKSYSVGNVTGNTNVGGLVGSDDSGSSSDSFWDNETSGQSTSAFGTGKITAQMKTITTFNDTATEGLTNVWSIALYENYAGETWYIKNGNDYPRLGWEEDFVAPNIEIVYPVNNTITDNSQLNINYTVSDNYLDSCWWSNNTVCYQETANVSTSCGGLDTGVYFTDNGFQPGGTGSGYPVYDEDWDTSASGMFDYGNGYVLVNYTKPSGAMSNSLWQVKDAGTTTNLTIPSACWNTFSDTLSFRIESYNSDAEWFCRNSTAWNLLRHYDSYAVFEEAMWWEMSTPLTCGTNITTVTWSQGTNTVTIWANDTSNNINSSSVTFTIDSVPPSVSSLTESPSTPATYSPGQSYEFNATVMDVSAIDTVLLEFDGTNYSATNLSADVYNVTFIDLAVGTYNYRWYANDSAGNMNSTETGSYTINKADPSSNMVISGTASITYPTVSDFSESETNTGDGGCSYSMDKSNQIYGVGESPVTFNYSTSGCANYTAGSVTKDLTINQNTTYVLSITGDTPITYGTTTNVAGGDCPAELSCALDITNAVYGVGESPVTFNYSTSGNTNYSANSITKDITINQASTSCQVLFNETSPITYPETFLVWSDCDSDFTLKRNDTIISNNSVQTLGSGTYNFSVQRTDTINYSTIYDDEDFIVNQASPVGSLDGTSPIDYLVAGDVYSTAGASGDGGCSYLLYRENILVSDPDTSVIGAGVYNYILNTTGCTNYSSSASMDTFALTVNQISSSINLTLDDIQGNASIEEDTSIDLNCSTLTGEGGAYLILYNNGTLINNGTSPIGNTTLFADPGDYNITCVYEETQNYTTSLETWWLEVNLSDIISPIISIIIPIDGYTVNDYTSGSVPIFTNFSLIEENIDSCWYTIDSGATNTSITCSEGYNNFTFFISSIGTFTLEISVNDSAGNENSTSISITMNAYTGKQKAGGTTINPSENKISDFKLFSSVLMCEETYKFLEQETGNYTSDQRESLKNKLASIFGFGVIDFVLDEYLTNFTKYCTGFEDPIKPEEEEEFLNKNEIILLIFVFLIAVLIAFLIVGIMKHRKTQYVSLKVKEEK